MTNTVIANGNTYTDDDNPVTGMGAGGFRARLMPMLSDSMHDMNIVMSSSSANAATAAASAASAVAAPGTNSTSTTSILVTQVPKNFTTQTGKTYVVGAYVLIVRTSNVFTWMFGQITAYNSGTGAMTVNVLRVQGSGTFTDWTIILSAPSGRDTGGAASNSASTTVGLASSRYQSMQYNGGGPYAWNISASPASQLSGPQAFALRNDYAGVPQDQYVTGVAYSGFLGPGEVARIDAGTSNYFTSDIRFYGVDVLQSVTFASVVAGTAGVWTRAVQLPSGNALVLVHGASLHAVVIDGTTGIAGTPALIRAGLSTAGSEITVRASVAGFTDIVTVASCPEAGTTLQIVTLKMTGTAISLGNVVPITLGSALGRVADLRSIYVSGGGDPRLVLSLILGTTTLATYGIIVTAGTNTTAVGAVLTVTTASSFGEVLTPSVAVGGVFVRLSASATVLTAQVITVSNVGVQSAGTSATLTLTTASNILLREHVDTVGDPWLIAFTSTLPKLTSLLWDGLNLTFGTPLALTASITTASGYALTPWISNASNGVGMAVSGTDASGRFLAELSNLPFVGGSLSAIVPVTLSAAATVVWAGWSIAGWPLWQILSASELVVATTNPTFTGDPLLYRLGNIAAFAQVLSATEANYPRYSLPRSTICNAPRAYKQNFYGVTDGSKPSLGFSYLTGSATATKAPISLVNNTSFASISDDTVGAGLGTGFGTWLAAGPAPALTLTIQRVRAT